MEKYKKLKMEYHKVFEELQKNSVNLENVKNMMFVCPSCEELNNLPDTVEIIFIDYLDNSPFVMNLPLFLKFLIILNPRKTEDEIKSQFKIPFGCKIILSHSHNKKLAQFAKLKGINSSNTFTRQNIDGFIYCFEVIVEISDDSIVFYDESPAINKLVELKTQISKLNATFH